MDGGGRNLTILALRNFWTTPKKPSYNFHAREGSDCLLASAVAKKNSLCASERVETLVSASFRIVVDIALRFPAIPLWGVCVCTKPSYNFDAREGSDCLLASAVAKKFPLCK